MTSRPEQEMRTTFSEIFDRVTDRMFMDAIDETRKAPSEGEIGFRLTESFCNAGIKLAGAMGLEKIASVFEDKLADARLDRSEKRIQTLTSEFGMTLADLSDNLPDAMRTESFVRFAVQERKPELAKLVRSAITPS